MRAPRRPRRRCCGCGQRRPQAELVRLSRGARGVGLDPPVGARLGRGAYVCARMECLQAAGRRGAVARTLRLPRAAVDTEGLLAGLAARVQSPGAPQLEDRSSPS